MQYLLDVLTESNASKARTQQVRMCMLVLCYVYVMLSVSVLCSVCVFQYTQLFKR